MVFRPGSTLFWPGPRGERRLPDVAAPDRAPHAAGPSCLRLVGHTSPTGSPAVNDRLSLARADHVRALLAERRRRSGRGRRRTASARGSR
jgi:hypothetical protein